MDNEGSSPQTGSINNTYAGWPGLLAALTMMLGYDLAGVAAASMGRLSRCPAPLSAPLSGSDQQTQFNMPGHGHGHGHK